MPDDLTVVDIDSFTSRKSRRWACAVAAGKKARRRGMGLSGRCSGHRSTSDDIAGKRYSLKTRDKQEHTGSGTAGRPRSAQRLVNRGVGNPQPAWGAQA